MRAAGRGFFFVSFPLFEPKYESEVPHPPPRDTQIFRALYQADSELNALKLLYVDANATLDYGALVAPGLWLGVGLKTVLASYTALPRVHGIALWISRC